MSTQSNQLNNFDKDQEGSGGFSAEPGQSLVPEISIREWYEGTRTILKERKSYKHRLEMMVIVGAEPVFDFK